MARMKMKRVFDTTMKEAFDEFILDKTQVNIKLYKAEETVKETYTDKELKLLLQKPKIKTCGFTEYRNWVIINLLLNCGCRAATLRSFLIKDVNLDNHTFAERYLQNGGNSLYLQKLLGHSTLAMTKHYCNIYDVDLVKTFDTFSPLATIK